jgi:hypothetical protein
MQDQVMRHRSGLHYRRVREPPRAYGVYSSFTVALTLPVGLDTRSGRASARGYRDSGESSAATPRRYQVLCIVFISGGVIGLRLVSGS